MHNVSRTTITKAKRLRKLARQNGDEVQKLEFYIRQLTED